MLVLLGPLRENLEYVCVFYVSQKQSKVVKLCWSYSTPHAELEHRESTKVKWVRVQVGLRGDWCISFFASSFVLFCLFCYFAAQFSVCVRANDTCQWVCGCVSKGVCEKRFDLGASACKLPRP